jgi:two-component system nitrate/nitrite response regulator NarL
MALALWYNAAVAKENVSSDMMQSVLLAHPNRLIRESIASVLQGAGFRVIGQAEDEPNLRKLAIQHKPDIILLDWEISEVRLDAVRGLTEDVPNAIAVILTRPQPSETFVEAMKEGVKGYLSVNLSPEEFVQSLHMIVKGDIVVSRDMAGEVQKVLTTTETAKSAEDLSNREKEVLGLIGNGATNREIAQRLIISEHTVKVHLRNILNKLDLRNRQQAAAYAAKKGLVKDEQSESNPETIH